MLPSSNYDAEIFKQLVKLNDAIDALPAAIAKAVAAELLEPVEPEPAAVVGCQHPEDKRVDLGGGDWDCGVRGCHFQHREPVTVPV